MEPFSSFKTFQKLYFKVFQNAFTLRQKWNGETQFLKCFCIWLNNRAIWKKRKKKIVQLPTREICSWGSEGSLDFFRAKELALQNSCPSRRVWLCNLTSLSKPCFMLTAEVKLVCTEREFHEVQSLQGSHWDGVWILVLQSDVRERSIEFPSHWKDVRAEKSPWYDMRELRDLLKRNPNNPNNTPSC